MIISSFQDTPVVHFDDIALDSQLYSFLYSDYSPHLHTIPIDGSWSLADCNTMLDHARETGYKHAYKPGDLPLRQVRPSRFLLTLLY